MNRAINKLGNIKLIDLEEEINKIIKIAPQINKIYIFGSRAFKTGSRSSDIDILVVSEISTVLSTKAEYVEDTHNPLDIFETKSINSFAQSIKTGGYINIRPNGIFRKKNIVKQLQAVLLWDGVSKKFTKDINDFKNIAVYDDAIFLGSVMPEISSITNHLKYIDKYCSDYDIPNTLLGADDTAILEKIAKIIKVPFEKTFLSTFHSAEKAKNFNESTIKIENEYDFQNLIYCILKPWIPSISILKNQDAIIVIDGNKKVADLSFNNFLIEAKYISSTNAKDSIVKSLQGLKTFYNKNPRVKGILFPILCENNVNVGESELADLVNDARTKLFLILNNLKK